MPTAPAYDFDGRFLGHIAYDYKDGIVTVHLPEPERFTPTFERLELKPPNRTVEAE